MPYANPWLFSSQSVLDVFHITPVDGSGKSVVFGKKCFDIDCNSIYSDFIDLIPG